MAVRNRRRRGSAILEFALVGIPLIFVLASVFTMSFAMWNYHTLARAIQEAARNAALRGNGCLVGGNSCSITVDGISHGIAATAIGLAPANLNVDLTSSSGTVQCHPIASCYGNTSVWPPSDGGSVGSPITVSGAYAFPGTAILFWPGVGSSASTPGVLTASSRRPILF